MPSSSHILESGSGVTYEGEAPRKKEKDRKQKPEKDHGAIQEGHEDERQDVTAVKGDLQKMKRKGKRGNDKGDETHGMIHGVTSEEVAKESQEEGSQEKRKNKKYKHNKDRGGIQEVHKGGKQDVTVLIETEEDLQKKRRHNESDAGANAASDSVHSKEEMKKKVPSSRDGSGFIHEEEGSQGKKKRKNHKRDKDCGGIQERCQVATQYDLGKEVDMGKMKKKRKHKHESDAGVNPGSILGFIHEEEGFQEKKKSTKNKHDKDIDEDQYDVGKEKDLGEKKKKKRKHMHEMDTGDEVKDKGDPSSDDVLKSVDNSRKDKKKKKQKQDFLAAEADQPKKSGVSGPEVVDGVNGFKNGKRDKKKMKKEKGKAVKHGFESESQGNGKHKKVTFSGHVEVFPSPDRTSDADQCGGEKLVRGKRYTKEEDELLSNAVHNYIEAHGLGEEGVEKVMKCQKYPEIKACWKEIGAAIPWRPRESVYCRAHVLFERSESHKWTPEECEFVLEYVAKHGPRWRNLADELGKHRFHVKDTWRRIKLANGNKGRWSQEEYQKLFDLVNIDLRLKASEEKKLKHGMLRDNICWGAVSDKLSTRAVAPCCMKWYNQLSSPMTAEGIWADSDDYRLLDALTKLDACCIEDVDWDNLLEHRSGDACRTRWDEMVRYIGQYAERTFSEQVDILAERYRPDLLEARVAYENKPAVDMP